MQSGPSGAFAGRRSVVCSILNVFLWGLALIFSSIPQKKKNPNSQTKAKKTGKRAKKTSKTQRKGKKTYTNMQPTACTIACRASSLAGFVMHPPVAFPPSRARSSLVTALPVAPALLVDSHLAWATTSPPHVLSTEPPVLGCRLHPLTSTPGAPPDLTTPKIPAKRDPSSAPRKRGGRRAYELFAQLEMCARWR